VIKINVFKKYRKITGVAIRRIQQEKKIYKLCGVNIGNLTG